jgi:putative transposase
MISPNLSIFSPVNTFRRYSDGSTKEPPKFYRHAEEKLTELQAKRDKRTKGSKPRRKLNQRIAKLHQKTARQRKQWHYELAGELLDKADVLFVEDLQVSNMTRRAKPKQDKDGTYLPNGQSTKSGLNKSFADAGIAGFINEILPHKAEKAGKRVIKVNPKGTSQHCSNCLNRVPKELSDRWHNCPHCNFEIQRDINSGILIKKVGLGVCLTIKREGRKTGEARALSVG